MAKRSRKKDVIYSLDRKSAQKEGFFYFGLVMLLVLGSLLFAANAVQNLNDFMVAVVYFGVSIFLLIIGLMDVDKSTTAYVDRYPVVGKRPFHDLIFGLMLLVMFAFAAFTGMSLGIPAPTQFSLVSLLFIVGVLGPIAEEPFFRGALFPTLTRWFGSSLFGAGATSIVFGLWHFTVYQTSFLNMNAMLTAIFLSVIFCVILYLYKALLPLLMAHIGLNLGLFFKQYGFGVLDPGIIIMLLFVCGVPTAAILVKKIRKKA